MERVGYSDAKVTLRIYNHFTKKAKMILLMHLLIYKKRTCYKWCAPQKLDFLSKQKLESQRKTRHGVKRI